MPTARSTSPTRPTGSRAGTRATRPKPEVGGCHVFRSTVTATLNVVADDFDRPNGLAFTPRRARGCTCPTPARRGTCACSTSTDDGSLSSGERVRQVHGRRLRRLPARRGRPDLDERRRRRARLRPRRHADRQGARARDVANVAWGGPKRNRLYICATTSLYAILLPVPERRRCSVIDLHVHFPMRLLGGVEAPRDVLRGMTRVARARRRQDPRGGAGDRRAAVQLPPLGRELARDAAAARAGRRDRRLLACCTGRSREMDLDEPFGAPPESAYYAKLDRADGRDRARGRGAPATSWCASRADLERRAGKDRVRPLHRGRLPPRRRARRGRRARPRARASAASCTSRSRTCSGARWRPTRRRSRSSPTRSTTCCSRSRRGRVCRALGEAAVRAMYEHGVLVDISHMRDDAIDDDVQAGRGARRAGGRDPRAYPVIASHAGYRFGAQKYNAHRRPRSRRSPRAAASSG